MLENNKIEDYILYHIDKEDEYLYRLYRATYIHTIHGRMSSGHLQGKLPVSYTHLTLPTKLEWCRSRWSPYH